MINIRLKFSAEDLRRIQQAVKTDNPALIPFNQNYVTLVHAATEEDLAKWKPLLQPSRMVVMFLCNVHWNPALQCVSVSWHGQDLHDMFAPGANHILPLRGVKGTYITDCQTMVETPGGFDTAEAFHVTFMGYVIAEATNLN
jgi:hypothetical protein